MEGLLSSRDLCKSKWAASLKVQMDPFMYNISSPPSFAVLIEGRAVRSASATAAQAMYCVHMEPSHAGGTN